MSDKGPPSTKHVALGVGCIVLFALPFAVAGLAISGWAVFDLWSWSDAQQWIQTPARLISAKLEVKPDDDGNVTYKATAHYRYEFGGRDYESRRVAIATGSDNVGSYQQDRGRELERLLRAGRPTVCYVNPDDPSQALLFRDFRPGYFALKLIAGLLFGSVGLGLLVAGWIGLRKLRREAALAAAHPAEPWRWRDDWSAGRLQSDTRTKAWGAAGVALFWNAISLPTFIGAMLQDDVHWGAKLLIALFPLVGAGLAYWAILVWLQYRRWGVSEFEMAASSGVLGGPLAGIIHAPGGIEPPEGFTLTLACVRRVNSGDNTRCQTLWEQERNIQRNLVVDDGRTLIPVQFVIPYDLPPSAEKVEWKLSVHAAVPGADYHAEFQPPVFHTAASSPNPVADAAVSASIYAPPPDFPRFVVQLGAELVEDSPDCRTIYFPPFRNRLLGVTMIAVTVLVTAIAVGLFFSPTPRMFVWSSTGFATLMFLLTVNAVLERTQLTFGQRGLVVENSVLRTTRTELPLEHVTAIDVVPTNTSVGGTNYHRVIARELGKHDGSTITLANEIARRQHAERLAEEIRVALGLSSQRKDAENVPTLEDELPEELR